MNKLIATIVAAAAASLGMAPVFAETRSGVTTIVIAFPPGGSTDVIARMVAKPLQDRTKQTVVVDYKPGGNGAIANAYVRAQKPDGQTLYLVPTSYTTAPATNPSINKYDPVTDFTPISRLTTNAAVLMSGAAFPPNNLVELMAYTKANPGKVRLGVEGVGTQTHLTSFRMAQKGNMDILIVPYKGAAQTATAVLAGEIELRMDSLGTARGLMETGKVKVIAMANATRSRLLPNYGTISEVISGVSLNSYFAIVGPPGMPAEITANLNKIFNEIIQSEELADRLKSLAMEPATLSLPDLHTFLANSLKEQIEIVKDSGIKLE